MAGGCDPEYQVVIIETETNVKENCASWLFKPINLLNKSILYCFILCDFKPYTCNSTLNVTIKMDINFGHILYLNM